MKLTRSESLIKQIIHILQMYYLFPCHLVRQRPDMTAYQQFLAAKTTLTYLDMYAVKRFYLLFTAINNILRCVIFKFNE